MNPPRLLRTKLYIPEAHPDLVDRTWLARRLEEGLRYRLVVISAPAGSGKTTLLSRWARSQAGQQSGLRLGWVSLDERDNEPARFWTYFIAGLQSIIPEIGATALALLQAPQPPPLEAILVELINEIDPSGPDFALVLDDYHVIEDPSIHTGIAFLLDNLPSCAHLVISGRSEPPLPLPRLRARRLCLELSAADLRFRPDEIDVFLNQVMGLNLPPGDVAALERITEGWAAGLQLAALALQAPVSMQDVENTSQFIRSFSGTHRYVFDYLALEVLSRQPPHVKDFLLKTSILERMCAPLCDSIVETFQRSNVPTFQRANEILEYLERANLFLVPQDAERHWYRYHRLFADFLRARLELEGSPGLAAELHSRASQWYWENQFPQEAVLHALQAKDYPRAAGQIRLIGPDMFVGHDLITLKGWFGRLPETILRADAKLSMIRVWAHLATSDLEPVVASLHDVESALGARADGSPESLALPAEVRGALAEISAIRANLAFHRADPGNVLALSQRAVAYLAEDAQAGLVHTRFSLLGVIAFNRALAYEILGETAAAIPAFEDALRRSREELNQPLIALCTAHLGNLQSIQGQLQAAEKTYREVLDGVDPAALRQAPLTALASVGLGNVLFERNVLEQARVYLEQGIQIGNLWANVESLIPGYTGLARLQAACGDLPGAFAALDTLEALLKNTGFPQGLIMVEECRARLFAQQGDREAVARWAETVSLPPEGPVPYLLEGIASSLARVRIALGQVGLALPLIARLLDAARQNQRWGRVIELDVLRAGAYQAQGETEKALQDLAEALPLAVPQGYTRIIIEAGEPVRDLLAAFRRSQAGVGAEIMAGAVRLLTAFDQSEGKPSAAPAVAAAQTPLLSEREIELLRLVAQGLSNQEIAGRLYISLNTVKSHVKNIIAKLEVTNRTQAAARAREIGLL